ncbi:NAD-dependent epimerase [Marivirga tractuosa]|uniref:NAD-dependent epimerase/dehydratase n=1 Tax=Marivirga tractuosa (strain ATCC 23168 / DSM 4126 / NBRC 15989 / NCIMB 1408 / VKM B-1430 / H-43) TaxID=643867 RepID=E4TQC0_MARTH|nr:NAD-dependent epimerase [Marivirga tractuosa]ADR22643.1 NAD-dependent epimerase/dehydratase [Marivirga tractuosa DSM 4126]BDD16686.1 NAD-dependent epimerase [Marivirga tractuosa]
MKVLVTGSAGFIGYHLANYLLERGDEVVGLDSINDYYDINLKYGRLKQSGIYANDIKEEEEIKSSIYQNYTFTKSNLENDIYLSNLFNKHKFDVVINLAAQAGVRYSLSNPKAYIKSNIEGFVNILEACRHNNVKNLVYASSSSVYGSNTKVPFSVHDNVDHPVSLYAASKKSNELMAHTYSHLFGLPTTGLRFFTVYGPWGRPDMALFIFTKAIIEGKPIDVFNYGNMVRDFTYINDIVKGIVKTIDNPAKPNEDWNSNSPDPASSKAPYNIYNIGNSSPIKLLDFIEAIEEKLGMNAKMNKMPIQPGDVPFTYADVTDLTKNFDYKPKTNIREGVANFIEWYLNFYNYGN